MKLVHEDVGGAQPAADRRTFFKRVGLASAGVVGATYVGSKLGMLDNMPGAGIIGLKSSAVHAASLTDIDILNFALNLEYLEAEFYTVATTGKTIAQIGIGVDGVGNPGDTTGGEKVHFRGDGDRDEDDEIFGNVRAIAREIAFDEQQHVLLLRAALGNLAIAKPAINLDALNTGFESLKQFLQLARAFEDVGVTAYGGAAPLLSSKEILATAARIALTEALHAGNVRLLVAENEVRTSALDNKDILPPPSGRKYFGVNHNGLTMVRTPGEVLAIVYGNSAPGTTSGGFFPNGVNGTIATV